MKKHKVDREWIGDDGDIYSGHDNKDGTTDWYDSAGNYDNTTNTPSDDSQDEMNWRLDGYRTGCPHCKGTGYDEFGHQCEYCMGTGERW